MESSSKRSLNFSSIEALTNDSECVPAGEMHRQVAINDIYVQLLFGMAYSAVWFVGVLSNTLILVVVFSIISGRGPTTTVLTSNTVDGTSVKSNLISTDQRRRRNKVGTPNFTVRTIFVGSLACSDLLTVMTSLPVTAVNLFTDEWPFPAFVCPGVGFLQALSIFQSSFTFTAIAVDRFLLIIFPGSRWVVTYRTARVVVIGTALLAFVLAFPMVAFVSVIPLPPMCGEFCTETWPNWASSIINQRTYGLFVLTLQFGLPAFVVAICYLTIGRHLQKTQKVGFEKLQPRSKFERRSLERRLRANAMMISMLCCFFLFWCPFNVLNVLRDFGLFPYLFDWSLFGVLYATGHLVAMTSVVWNPFIYAWYNRSIRESILAMLRGCWANRKNLPTEKRDSEFAMNSIEKHSGEAQIDLIKLNCVEEAVAW